MKEIGGYFELELSKSNEYHNELIKLKSGRNTFKYILKTRKPKKVYIPNYICDSVIEPLEELSITYEFFNVDENFEIVKDIILRENELVFYVNYFALKSRYVKNLIDKYGDKLIVDNTQAFFEKPLKSIDTIYSPRKFFGVSDGGYLSTDKYLDEKLEQDCSYGSSIQLLGRVDKNAFTFYDDYQKAEQRLKNQPIKKMSNLTQSILASIDYEEVIKKRKENFLYLHEQLRNINLINVENDLDVVPFVYPLMIKNENLRQKLIENKIYVAKYWNEVLTREDVSNVEKNFVNQIIPLPCDQRYDLDDVKIVIKMIYKHSTQIKKNNDFISLIKYFKGIDNNYSRVLGNNSSFDNYCEKLSKNAEIFYLELENEKIGILAFYANNVESKRAYISSISVLSKYYGYGFGKKLLEFLVAYLKKIKFIEIELEVQINNFKAISFYRKFGFMEIARKDNFLIMRKEVLS